MGKKKKTLKVPNPRIVDYLVLLDAINSLPPDKYPRTRYNRGWVVEYKKRNPW